MIGSVNVWFNLWSVFEGYLISRVVFVNTSKGCSLLC